MEEIASIAKPKILAVEGKDEKNFFDALLMNLQLTDIQVMDIGGKSNFPAKLKAIAFSPNFGGVISLGIIRDADDNPMGAFKSICNAIMKVKLSVPTTQMSFTSGSPKTGIMILPKPGVKGMLEDICLESIKDTPEMECIQIYFDCIKKKTKALPRNFSKALTYTFLAAKAPGLRLGEAAQRGIWQWNNKAFKEIKKFVGLL